MEKRPRLRAPNFTSSDNMLLCDIVAKYKNIIENKKTDGANLQQKQVAWKEVTAEYNATTSGCHRTVDSLQYNYKNLKKKLKKSESDKKMNIPVETLVNNLEQYGTSSEGWAQVAAKTGVPEAVCQETVHKLIKEADAKEKNYKRNIMGTGGGPPPSDVPDPVLEKVKILAGPVIDGMYTVYDGDHDIMVSQNKTPLEDDVLEIEPVIKSPDTIKMEMSTPNSGYFTNDRGNLKKRPHHLLTRKRKVEDTSRQSVSDNFKKLADAKLKLVEMQAELIKIQLEDAKENLEQNRKLREIEMEEAMSKQKHNQLLRNLELERFK